MNLLSLWGVHSGMVCVEGYQFAGLCDIQNAALFPVCRSMDELGAVLRLDGI